MEGSAKEARKKDKELVNKGTLEDTAQNSSHKLEAKLAEYDPKL